MAKEGARKELHGWNRGLENGFTMAEKVKKEVFWCERELERAVHHLLKIDEQSYNIYTKSFF